MNTCALLILTHLPDAASADRMAAMLVEGGLAACVNCLPSVQSVYRWQGKIEHAQEIALLIKTRVDRYAEVEQAIRTHHPYELPEIIAMPITHGLPAYIRWISDESENRGPHYA